MFNELHDLSLAMRTVSESHASRVVMAVLRKFDSYLRNPLIRIYRKEPAKSGIILKPFAINRSQLEPEPVNIAFDDTPQGILSWSYHQKKPLWLEFIKDTDLSKGAVNKCDGETISADYLDFTYDPDSTIVLPLMAEGRMRGVFSLELKESGFLNAAVLEELRNLGASIARILHKSSMHQSQLEDTTRYIEGFLDRLADFELPSGLFSEDIKTGFIARPFGAPFDSVAELIRSYFKNRKILVSHYQPSQSDKLVMNDLRELLKNSHFGIVDITGCNGNVMLELGMLIEGDKRLLIMRERNDDVELPFDASGFPHYPYEHDVKGDAIKIWMPSGETKGFDEVLNAFVKKLEEDPSFSSAKDYV